MYDGDFCGHQFSTESEMHQHYWDVHPECFMNGFVTRNIETGVVWSDEYHNQVPDLVYVQRVLILRKWLGLDMQKFDRNLMQACWEHIEIDADNHDGHAKYERVEQAMTLSGYVQPSDEAVNTDDIAGSSSGENVVASPPKRKQKLRTCSLCNQTGHDRRNCKQQQQQQQQQRSSPRLSPIRNAPLTPARTPHYSATPSPASPETVVAATSPASPPKQSCAVQ